MPLFDKGIEGAPGLTHPGTKRGHKQRRGYMGRARLFAKGDAASANGVHSNGDMNAEPKRRAKLSIAYDPYHALTKDTDKADRAAIKQVMDRWKAGKLHSGKGGAIVSDQDQAIAIALSEINKTIVAKANPNHDAKGRFTSGGDPAAAGASSDKGSDLAYQSANATGQAIGSTAGALGGGLLGAAAGSFLGAPAAGKFVGSTAGGLAGDYVGRRIAGALYQALHPGYTAPSPSIASDVAGGIGSTAGYMAGGAIGRKAAPAAVSAAEATARVLGNAGGDLVGTRFGAYVSQRVGGVFNETKDQLAQQFRAEAAPSPTASPNALTSFHKVRRTLGDGPLDVSGLKAGGSRFPARASRDDMGDDVKTLREQPAATRFRTLLAGRDTDATLAQARLSMYSDRRFENLHPDPVDSLASFRRKVDQALADQKVQRPFPWSGAQKRRLFEEDEDE